MAVGTNTSFNLRIADLIEEALELVGGEPNTGSELKDGMRSLNLLLIDLQNRGIFLHTIEEKTIDLVAGDDDYTLDSDTVDVVHAVLRRNSVDTQLIRLGFQDYNRLALKSLSNRPTSYYVDRQIGAPVMHVWPVPDNSTDQIIYRRVRSITDTDTPINNIDVPRRYLPAITFGMAHFFAMRRGLTDENTLGRATYLQAQYERALRSAQREDRERVDQRFLPRMGRWR